MNLLRGQILHKIGVIQQVILPKMLMDSTLKWPLRDHFNYQFLFVIRNTGYYFTDAVSGILRISLDNEVAWWFPPREMGNFRQGKKRVESQELTNRLNANVGRIYRTNTAWFKKNGMNQTILYMNEWYC